MLKRENRLLKRKDFGEIREKGRMSWGQMMGMSYIKNLQSSDFNLQLKNRFGVVVSKKISNLAVVRNRIRRQIYKAIGDNLKKMESKGYKIVFLVKKNIVGVKNGEVEREVGELLNKLDLRFKK
ncbi:ribonuclease P protein component [Candidatus Shapirobacteria bacterium]|nr:ribonuclease P protein component [Candidatus Shapirobacteria bacterium]